MLLFPNLMTHDESSKALDNHPEKDSHLDLFYGSRLKKSGEKPTSTVEVSDDQGATGNDQGNGAGNSGNNQRLQKADPYHHVKLAQSGDWDGAIEHARRSRDSNALAMLPSVEGGVPAEHFDKLLNAMKSRKDSNGLFELAHNLPSDLTSNQLQALANAAPDDYTVRSKVLDHPSLDVTPEIQSKMAPHLFWNSYEKKVDPRHFAVIAHHMDEHGYLDSGTHRGNIEADEYPTHMVLDHGVGESAPGYENMPKWRKGTGEPVSDLSLQGRSEISMDQVFPHLDTHAKAHQNALMHLYHSGNPDNFDIKYFSGKPYIKLYRGVNGEYANKVHDAFNTGASSATFKSAPFSSWTHEPDMAARFANNRGVSIVNGKAVVSKTPIVISQWHPIENVLHTGFHRTDALFDNAHENEREVVVKHPGLKHKIRKTDVHVADPDLDAAHFENYKKR